SNTTLAKQDRGGPRRPERATAEAARPEATVGTLAVADEPATSPSLATEAEGTNHAVTAATDEPPAGDAPEAEAPAVSGDSVNMREDGAADAPAAETAAPAEGQLDEPAEASSAAEPEADAAPAAGAEAARAAEPDAAAVSA